MGLDRHSVVSIVQNGLVPVAHKFPWSLFYAWICQPVLVSQFDTNSHMLPSSGISTFAGTWRAVPGDGLALCSILAVE